MRVERIGDCTLYNGDCLEVIPKLDGVRVVCTDPPYGIEDIVGGYGRGHATIANDKTLDVCMDALQASCRIAPSARWAVFYSPRVRRQFFRQLPPELHDMSEVIWDKKAPGMGRGIRYQHETAALFYTGDEKRPLNDIFSVVRDYRSAETHPHQKPLGIIKTLLRALGDGLVLDPFMGSGTTGVACAQMGLPFVGVELDSEHFETCVRRVKEAYAQGDMFVEAPSKMPKPADMFANDNKQEALACA